MTVPNLKSLTNEALHTGIRALHGKECEVIAEIVLHLQEIKSRGIYRDAGYPSLFKYCTGFLGYSEGSAYRRTEAVKVLDTNPEVYERLKSGKVSLDTVGTVAKVPDPGNRSQALSLAQGKPKLEVERIAIQCGAPAPKSKRESVRVVQRELKSESAPEPKVEERISVHYELTREEYELYEQARAFIGTRQMKDVMVRTMKEFVQRRTRKPRARKSTSTMEVGKSAKSRYISRAVQREVRERDGNRCTFESEDKIRCTECEGLQFDHVTPWAKGGDESAENLRLLCSAHNQLVAERAFGREFMQGKRPQV